MSNVTRNEVERLLDIQLRDWQWERLKALLDSKTEINPTHSCSCHVQNKGPCAICRELSCVVWDFNQVSVLRNSEMPVSIDHTTSTFIPPEKETDEA